MQVRLNKVTIADTRSQFHNQLVDLVIDNGVVSKIKAVEKTTGKPSVSVDGEEMWKGQAGETLLVSPGWVDVFADYREPGYEHKETITSGLAAAAAGGFTDVLTVPNTQPVISTKGQVQYLLRQAAGNVVSLHPMGSASQQCEGKELAEMLDMREHGAVAFTDGWKPIQNTNLLLKALEYIKAFNGTLVQLPVDTALAGGGLMHEGIVSTALGMPGIPYIAETLAIHKDIELARYTGSKLHITGVSTAEGVDMIRKAKAEGVRVTCSVTPYHLALTDDMLNSYDSAFKVSPPLRTERDRMALIEALQHGVIDCIASHHRPQEWDAKAKEFDYAADGMAVQENTFNILWDALKEYIDAGMLVEALAIRPREIFGLGHSVIEKNSNVALTIFSTDGTSTITENNKQSIASNQPFLDRPLAGRVIGIINNDQVNLNM